jgi:hypothetical protein
VPICPLPARCGAIPYRATRPAAPTAGPPVPAGGAARAHSPPAPALRLQHAPRPGRRRTGLRSWPAARVLRHPRPRKSVAPLRCYPDSAPSGESTHRAGHFCVPVLCSRAKEEAAVPNNGPAGPFKRVADHEPPDHVPLAEVIRQVERLRKSVFGRGGLLHACGGHRGVNPPTAPYWQVTYVRGRRYLPAECLTHLHELRDSRPSPPAQTRPHLHKDHR